MGGCFSGDGGGDIRDGNRVWHVSQPPQPQPFHSPLPTTKYYPRDTTAAYAPRHSAAAAAFCDYRTRDEWLAAMRQSGAMEDMNVILGIDATGSNQHTGRVTYGGRCLHDVNTDDTDLDDVSGRICIPRDNPYIVAIKSALTLLQSDADAEYPVFFFGSEQAAHEGGVSHIADCRGGLADVLRTYRMAIHQHRLSGPTTFIPLIRRAIDIVRRTGRYHILLIFTDGAVETVHEHLHCLAEASHYPLSIVCVGVGDGPFDRMQQFDDDMSAPNKRFDNFQFVELQDVLTAGDTHAGIQSQFFYRALMEVPQQYDAICRLLDYRRSRRSGAPQPFAAASTALYASPSAPQLFNPLAAPELLNVPPPPPYSAVCDKRSSHHSSSDDISDISCGGGVE